MKDNIRDIFVTVLGLGLCTAVAYQLSSDVSFVKESKIAVTLASISCGFLLSIVTYLGYSETRRWEGESHLKDLLEGYNIAEDLLKTILCLVSAIGVISSIAIFFVPVTSFAYIVTYVAASWIGCTLFALDSRACVILFLSSIPYGVYRLFV